MVAVSIGTMKMKEMSYTGYVIDLLEGLKVINSVFKLYNSLHYSLLLYKSLLSNPTVLDEIQQTHESTDGVMRDICDGEYVKRHPLFNKFKKALQFILYYDDIEVCNPLGSSAGIHKLGKIMSSCTCTVVWEILAGIFSQCDSISMWSCM